MIVVVMGVAGAGKSTVGRMLANDLGWEFIDGDEFHEPGLIAKMSSGMPLTDQDREAWLDRIAATIADLDRKSRSAVVACSALRQAYRDRITAASPDVRFVHLQGSYELIRQRMEKRQGHFMKADLLRSQFAVLEQPDNAIVVDVSADPETIVARIERSLAL